MRLNEEGEWLAYPASTSGATESTEVTGEALVCRQPISFLGSIDPDTGTALEGLDIRGQSVKGKILVYPTGAGSTVGSYVILNLVKNGAAPLGIINREMDAVVLSGAIWADIPVAHRFENGVDPLEVIGTGDIVRIDVRNGVVLVKKRTAR